METKKKIAMIWYWEGSAKVFDGWRDGLRAAIEILEKDYSVDWYLSKNLPSVENDYDYLLFWCGAPPPELQDALVKYKNRKALLYGACGYPRNFNIVEQFDIVFVENKPILSKFLYNNVNAKLAFGTDSNFYMPTCPKFITQDSNIECARCNVSSEYHIKDIEYFYPATFAPHKRQEYISMIGPDLTCVGSIQPDASVQLKACFDYKVNIVLKNLPAIDIRNFYYRSKRVLIPAALGSERTVLEAMSMDIVPRVFSYNNNTVTLVAEFLSSPFISPRDFILNNYSAEVYAKEIKEGLESLT